MLGLLAFCALIAANAFFVADEFALVALDGARIEQLAVGGSRSARLVQRLRDRLSFHLSAAQLGITVSSLALGFVAEPTVARLLEPALENLFGGGSAGVSIVVALALATFFQVLLGEIVPKFLAIARPETVAMLLSRGIAVWGIAVKPLVALLNGMANAIVRAMGIEPREELDATPSLDELRMMIESSATEGTLDPEDVDLLTRSIRFSEKDAADALVPRVEVVALDRDDTIEVLVERSLETGFSRFPVIGPGGIDDIVGIVHVKSVYSLPPEQRPSTPVSAVMAEVFAVPETRELEHLFEDLRSSREHFAVVVDEHGGTAGIVTIEDLLEEIVGEIDDEYDVGSETTRVEQRGSYVVSAGLHPDEVAEATGFEMPEGPYETLAGFVLATTGEIPRPGDIITHDGWRIEVVAMRRHRIMTVRVVAPADAIEDGVHR